MYKKEYIKVIYLGETEYQGNKAHIVFYAQKIKGDGHIYDSAFIVKNEPKKTYKKLEQIPSEDLVITYREDGHMKNIEFK